MRSNWQYETCTMCTREQRLAWWVSDAMWNRVVIPYYHAKTLCLECFLRMADDRQIAIELSDIEITGVVSRDEIGGEK